MSDERPQPGDRVEAVEDGEPTGILGTVVEISGPLLIVDWDAAQLGRTGLLAAGGYRLTQEPKPVLMGGLDTGKVLVLPMLKASAASLKRMLENLKSEREKLDGMMSELEASLALAEREISAYESMNSNGNFGAEAAS